MSVRVASAPPSSCVRHARLNCLAAWWTWAGLLCAGRRVVDESSRRVPPTRRQVAWPTADEGSDLGIEERIAAAAHASMMAANSVQSCIALEVGTMTSAWETAAAEADKLEVQAAAVDAFARVYKEQLARLVDVFPDGRPGDTNAESLPGTVLSRRPDGKWVVADRITERLDRDFRAAQSAAREASGRRFAGKQREQAKRMTEAVQGTIRALEAHASQLRDARTQELQARAAGADRIRASADERLRGELATLSDAVRRLPPAMVPWANPSWRSWTPTLTHSHVLLGMLRPQFNQAPGSNHSFAQDVRTPAFLPIREAVRLSHCRQDRDTTAALSRSIVLRALACTPPGKLRLSVFDPTGLGQSVASLLELGEYDRELIGGKIWSSTDDLRRLLAEHAAHIELVIQKYLRAEYATLDEFNAAAGAIAEPYRLLVVFDVPAGFDEPAFAELRRVVENGPRCGVATLLVTDEDVTAPYGISLDSLPSTLRTIRMHRPFGHSEGPSSVMFDLLPETDTEAPRDVIASIVDQIGKSAQDSTSSAVTFAGCLSLFNRAALEGRKRGLPRLTASVDVNDPATWWTQGTLETVSSPIGLRGARDVATLTFDSSNHSGALLVGRPGSGKSTLLHAFIAGITTLYAPEELELHLIDFKEGVEFKTYAANSLPHARTVAIESDREFGLSVLQTIQSEIMWRGSLLRCSTESHSSLETLRRATGERLPRILLVFDEFQVLFARNDKLGAAAAEALETLIRQGRGFGVHVLLGSQSLSGIDALGSHVPQLLPVRILLPAADADVFKVLGEGNTEGATLTAAGEGILNMSGGAVEANERFRGAVISEDERRNRIATMRSKADDAGFHRRPVVFEGNAPIPAEDTAPGQFVDEVRGAEARTLRLRFGAPMAIAGSADLNLRREAGANAILVARDSPLDVASFDTFSVPRAVTTNVALSAVARQASVEILDFLPIDEGLDGFFAPLVETASVKVSRRRQLPGLLQRLCAEVSHRIEEDETSGPAILLVLYGMHRARDFDQESVDYDPEVDLPDLLNHILRDGPEVGVHTFMWFETVSSISRRLPSSALREISWRLAAKMGPDDSSSFIGVDSADSLREQQVLSANEDRGLMQRCTTITTPSPQWTQEFMLELGGHRREPIE